MNKPVEYFPEIRERAVRMVNDHRSNYPAESATIEAIASKARLHGGDAAPLGAPGADGCWSARWRHHQ